jgi:hypothetical protein
MRTRPALCAQGIPRRHESAWHRHLALGNAQSDCRAFDMRIPQIRSLHDPNECVAANCRTNFMRRREVISASN